MGDNLFEIKQILDLSWQYVEMNAVFPTSICHISKAN